MGVGLLISGRFAAKNQETPERWLTCVENWLERGENEPLIVAEQAANHQEQPTLFWKIHPCAEEVELTVVQPGQLYLAAKTATVGPGYHVFLCELVKKLAREFRINWDPPSSTFVGDDSSFFYTGDLDVLEQQMNRWLQGVCQIVLR